MHTPIETVVAMFSFLFGVLVLIWLCVPLMESKPKRKGRVTVLPSRYDDPWAFNARSRDIR